jgi:hypothetical protein
MRLPFPSGRLPAALFVVVGAAGSAWLTGCTPVIGDSCTLSTDCASDGTRICDTAEPGGYCTVLNCTGNSLGAVCPDYAVCINFEPNVPGCPASVRTTARTAFGECRNTCSKDSDCRTDYFCRAPNSAPWSAQILDPDPTAKICLPLLVFVDGGTSSVNYVYDGAADAVPAVCQPVGPSFDAGFSSPDAAIDGGAARDAGDAGAHDGATDAKPDAKIDAAFDAGHDAGMDAAKDAAPDAGADAQAKDATGDAARDAADAG